MELKNLATEAVLVLPDDLLWTDEHAWTPAVASVSYLPAAGHPDHPALLAATAALLAAHPAPRALAYVTDVYLAPLPA